MSWDFFSQEEMTCTCDCDRVDMDDVFMSRLVLLRREAGFPFVVSSGFRCPEHNQRVSSSGTHGPHTTGQAVDICCSHKHAVWILEHAFALGFRGIGVSQKGPVKKRFLHLDDLATARGRPRPHVWSY